MITTLWAVSPRALNEVFTALEADFFPFPSLSLAFWEIVGTNQLRVIVIWSFTVKSAAFSFCFLVLLGILTRDSRLQVVKAQTSTRTTLPPECKRHVNERTSPEDTCG
jgi:hypothetical protein